MAHASVMPVLRNNQKLLLFFKLISRLFGFEFSGDRAEPRKYDRKLARLWQPFQMHATRRDILAFFYFLHQLFSVCIPCYLACRPTNSMQVKEHIINLGRNNSKNKDVGSGM